ncbi:TolC family protein [Prevotella sp. kh1p2]|uniref:TolC family protein n=1 Tax=Prevotella sp. kh1p2 TaxID=1761883 RepID=UPI0008AF2D32|nr:TolC family protein [Prevotella sp. kh1p2]SES73640.1 Outer membrane protein TolC [Prevotella sp. kh1p2]SNU10600.1 Outer membrane protein TolC [Prevotellaceae bacterium KH2P17]
MKKVFLAFGLWLAASGLYAQQVLTLDSCRALALRNNKQLRVSRLNQEVAANIKKAARTKYLPKVDALGGYEFFSKEVSLLNNSQKSALTNLGTNAVTGVGSALSNNLNSVITGLVQQGLLSPQAAQQLGALLQQQSGPITQIGSQVAQAGNQVGQSVVDAFRTDTKNIWAGAVMLRQPIFMGGAITAMNRMADIGMQLASNDLDFKTQSTLYNIDQAYWMVVSLREKQNLAVSYRDLVKKLNDDVHKMIREGVATRADGLKVDVKVNEADMQITQVEDGLALAKMLLCQLCGLPMDSNITLADENNRQLIADAAVPEYASDSISTARPEVRMLQNAVDMSQEATKLVRAQYLPHVALTGGYMISNPNVFDGFSRHFAGVWNVGVLVQVPVWNWFEGRYKVRASKAATNIALSELQDAQEKIELQVSQSRFKVKEAQKKYAMASQNLLSAEENLRCANVGFKEGVMEITDVMAAQTAWQMALSQRIDAEIDVKLTQVNLQKALGILQ